LRAPHRGRRRRGAGPAADRARGPRRPLGDRTNPLGSRHRLGVGLLVFLSFFAVVPALVLFGRTVGMALADLSVRSEAGRAAIDASEAARRWIGTLATGLTAGLPLIWTASDSQAPTPADRLSGRALTID